MSKGATVAKCLGEFEVKGDMFDECATLEDEWAVVKKAYNKKILVAHPDKGGDAAVFRGLRAAFEVLRDLYDKGSIKSFKSSGAKSTADTYSRTFAGFEGMPTPSWEFYAAAADEPVPIYRVEIAKTGRSACVAKGAAKKCDMVPGVGDDALAVIDDKTFIAQGDIRVGSINLGTGGYGRWNHLICWRVPSKIWMGLPNPDRCDDWTAFAAALTAMNCVLLSGFSELPPDDQHEMAEYVMDKENWAKLIKPKAKPQPEPAAAAAGGSGQHVGEAGVAGDALVVRPETQAAERFVVPVPGQDAPAGCLAGKTIVLTGVFPELGGGAGLSLGKERAKQMVESFGGRCTSTISGKTDFLLVGKAPGASKVSKARNTGTTKLITLHDLRLGLIEGRLEDLGSEPLLIDPNSFSKGFGNNGLAPSMSKADLALAAGLAPAALKGRRPKPKKRNMCEDGDDDDEEYGYDEEEYAPPKRKKAAPKKAPAAKKPAAKKAPAKKAAAADDDDDDDVVIVDESEEEAEAPAKKRGRPPAKAAPKKAPAAKKPAAQKPAAKKRKAAASSKDEDDSSSEDGDEDDDAVIVVADVAPAGKRAGRGKASA